MKALGLLVATIFAVTLPVQAQTLTNPRASFLDIPARMATLQSTTDPLLRAAIKSLPSCLNSPVVDPPASPMEIPHHYLSGSNGPTNPAEALATRLYAAYEHRITAGMNRYLATGDHAESACALSQLDLWAHANAFTNYDPRSQSWYQSEWSLAASSVTESVLINDPTLDPAQQQRVIAWLDSATHRLLSYERSDGDLNNHHYWRALAAISIGVTAPDKQLFDFAIHTFKQAIDELDPSGALPREMARHENATHYQGFALEPLILIAEFAARQGINLYAYQHHGRSIRDAILFFGRAVDDPSLITPYTKDPQRDDFRPNDFAAFVFYAARFSTDGLPPSITTALQSPTTATHLGGSTTVLAAK